MSEPTDGGTSRERGRALLISGVIVLVSVGAAWYWVSQWSVDPGPLRGPLMRLAFEPRTLQYCMVPRRATEAELRRRLGEPINVLHSLDEWREYREMRRVGDFSLPADEPPDERILVYLHAEGAMQVEAFYAIDATGRISWAFVSEN